MKKRCGVEKNFRGWERIFFSTREYVYLVGKRKKERKNSISLSSSEQKGASAVETRKATPGRDHPLINLEERKPFLRSEETREKLNFVGSGGFTIDRLMDEGRKEGFVNSDHSCFQFENVKRNVNQILSLSCLRQPTVTL